MWWLVVHGSGGGVWWWWLVVHGSGGAWCVVVGSAW